MTEAPGMRLGLRLLTTLLVLQSRSEKKTVKVEELCADFSPISHKNRFADVDVSLLGAVPAADWVSC